MKKVLTIIAGAILIVAFANAQNDYSIDHKRTIKIYEEGKNKYASGNTEEAEELLLKALDKRPEFMEALLLLGDLYHSNQQWEKEIDMLEKAVDMNPEFFPPTYYNLAKAYFQVEQYQNALNSLEKYKSFADNDEAYRKVDVMMERISFIKEAKENPHDIELRNIGDSVNSEFDEYWPSLTADEQTLVITVLLPRDMDLYREKDGELPKSSMFYQEDFYVAHADSAGEWQSRSVLPGHLNTSSNEGAQTLSADGNWMFFAACGRSDSKGSCDIYFSQRTDSGWSRPENLGAPVNTPFWERQPHFSADGKTLYFISNRSDGVGSKDIWKATVAGINDEGVPYFGNLENLGEPINTEKDENSPFLHHDGHTLFFSSNGHMGMGGQDIFRSRKNSDNEWSEPQNLGWPINTEKDEIGLVVTARGDKAYFATDGQDSDQGAQNIYSFNLPQELRPDPVLYVKGKVYDEETGEMLPADFELLSLENGETIITSKGSRFSGEFLVSLPTGGDYAFKADHPGYLFYSGNFNLSGDHPADEPYYLDIGLKPIKKGATVRLENVFFETDSYTLKSESKVELDEVVEFLNNNPDVRIMLEGHTDNVGTEAYNLELSENRARAVYNYLKEQGINEERLEFKGYGFSKPVESNETREGRARNRRTEMRIL